MAFLPANASLFKHFLLGFFSDSDQAANKSPWWSSREGQQSCWNSRRAMMDRWMKMRFSFAADCIFPSIPIVSGQDVIHFFTWTLFHLLNGSKNHFDLICAFERTQSNKCWLGSESALSLSVSQMFIFWFGDLTNFLRLFLPFQFRPHWNVESEVLYCSHFTVVGCWAKPQQAFNSCQILKNRERIGRWMKVFICSNRYKDSSKVWQNPCISHPISQLGKLLEHSRRYDWMIRSMRREKVKLFMKVEMKDERMER